jgi:tetratricopeptide (TPR) repeat protein
MQLLFAETPHVSLSTIKKQCRTGSPLPTLNTLTTAITARPEDADLLACLGELNIILGHQSAAIDSFKKSVAIDPDNTAVWSRLVALQRNLLEEDPGNHNLRLRLIEAMLHARPEIDCEKEIDIFLAAASSDEKLELTGILIRIGKRERAESILVELNNLASVPAEAHAQLGLILMEKEDFENAVLELGLAAQAQPKSSRYALALSEALLRWHHYSTAQAFLQAVKADFAGLPQFQYNLAYSYYGMRDLDSAISILAPLLKQNSKYAPALFLLGNCYVAKGNLTRGGELLAKALDVDKTRPAYYASLAQVRRYQGKTSEALLVVKQGLALDPDNFELIFESALCHESQGDLSTAQDQLEKLVAKQPGLVKAHRALARVYGRMGNGAAAEGERQKLAQLENEERTPEQRNEDKR